MDKPESLAMMAPMTEAASNPDPAPRPFRRKVFYIPGYDPIPPRRYRELYRREGAAQAAQSGYSLALHPKHGGGPYGWQAATNGAKADIEVLVWSDIVRNSMQQGILATYVQLLRTAWAYIASGALFRLMRLRKGPTIAALYPIGLLLVQLALAIGTGWLAALAVFGLLDWATAGLEVLAIDNIPRPSQSALAPLVNLAVLASVAFLVLLAFKQADGRLFAYYLMHDYAFTAQNLGANPPELEGRMAEFRATIAAALTLDHDEVLVVGHSSGAHLAVSILADLIRRAEQDGGLPQPSPALAFLSLGQVVPMISFLPRANRLRADLRYLSARSEITWVDVTAPGDGCAFALCDPVAVTGVAPPDKRWPLVISAAFTQTLSPERWKSLRWRFFRLHFQYLCAFDRPRDYDYFQITAGPLTLAERFANRAPSPARIETPLSGYRAT